MKHADPKPGPGEEDLEPEELLKKEIARDPWEKRLKPIQNDAKTRGGMPSWLIRSYDTQSNLVDEKTGKANKNYGTVVVRSLWWPGAFTMYNNGRTQQIYCGDGQKAEPAGTTYYPVLPPVMIDERDEGHGNEDGGPLTSPHTTEDESLEEIH